MSNDPNTPVPAGENQTTPAPTEAPVNNSASEPVVDKALEQPVSTEESEVKAFVPAPNVVQDFATREAITKDVEKVDPLIALPSDTAENIKHAIDSMPFDDVTKNTKAEYWVTTNAYANVVTPFAGWFQRTVTRPDSAYRQQVESEKGPISARVPKINDGQNTLLTGNRALVRARALMGMGTIISIPLWHSGFWITFKAPSDSSLLELHRRLTEEKIQLGRRTHGLAFANNSVIMIGWLMDFALAHVHDISLKQELHDSLRTRISSLDIPIILWGLACTIWPKGFPYSRAVMNQTPEQYKVIKEILKVTKLLWCDTSRLTPWQRSHMAQSNGNTMTEDAVTRYRNEFTIGKNRVVKIEEDVSVTLRVPSVDQYLTSGNKWVNGIVSMVDQAFALQANDSVRDSYILDQGKATNMRQYVHWAESIDLAGDIVSDDETIDNTFDVFSARDDVRDTFFNSVKEFAEDSTIAIVAIPVTENSETGPLPHMPHLIPLDVAATFFTLLERKATQIQER